MSKVFISHSDNVTSTALERILRDALGGSLQVFNTGRAATGLAAGESVDSGILRNIRESSLFIWMVTPSSVKKSFWMAWELGVAYSFIPDRIVPVRCLGLEPGGIPLLQGGRNAFDLGNLDELRSFLQHVAAILGIEDNTIGEATKKWEGVRTPFWGTRDLDGVSLKVLGTRLLIENLTLAEVRVLQAEVRPANTFKVPLRVGDVLAPEERRILEAGNLSDLPESSSLYLEWATPLDGRFFSELPIERAQ